MAKATNKSSTAIYLPPGFRRLTDVVAVQGPDTVRDQLATGTQQAFGLNVSTGKLVAIPLEVWRSHAALEVLEGGVWIRVFPKSSLHGRHKTEDLVAVVPDKPTALTGGTKPIPAATPTKPLGPKEWLAQACKDNPRDRNETNADYARRLYKLPGVPPSWKTWKTLLRRLNDWAPERS